MAKVKKHQHVVPRTYLKGWVDSDDYIAVLDRGGAAPKRLPMSNSAVRKGFYNFIDAGGEQSDAVENWLDKHIEAPVGATLQALRAGSSVDDENKATIVNFTVAQLIRTPTVFAIMDHLDMHLGALFLLSQAAETGGFDLLKLTQTERDRCLASAEEAWAEHQDARETKSSKLRTMVRELDKISAQVMSWHWSVLTSPTPVLITADSPVATIDPISYGWSGLLPTGSPLWMPLSPTVLLVGDPVKPLGPQARLNSELAAVVTGALVRQVDRSLFNVPGVPWPSGLVLPAQKPQLSRPTVTWSAPTGPSTFPADFPPASSGIVQSLLDKLGAVDTVE